MALTILTLAIVFSMCGLFISLFVGTFGGKADSFTLPSLVIFSIVIPLILSIIFSFFLPLVTLFDWPAMAIPLPPQSAIFLGCIVGGLLGMKAGSVWYEENDRSCLQCLLVPISLLTLGSLVVLFFL